MKLLFKFQDITIFMENRFQLMNKKYENILVYDFLDIDTKY